MIVSELKKGICVIAALGLAVLSNGIAPVYAEGEDPSGNVPVPSADRTSEQYYFQSEYGIAFPGWNQYEDGQPAANVDPQKEIVVAVVGTGVDYTHEDLVGVMWDKGETIDALTKLGGGKYGFNANGGTDKSDPMDAKGDGTRAASLIAAEWNGKGISGALSGVKIMAVKAASAGTAASGLRYVLAAKKAGVNIAAVDLSSAVITTSNVKTVSDLASQLGEAGVITVIPAGDKGADLDTGSSVYETLRANPYVIVAGATDRNGALWSSSYGKRNCSVLAPGEDILAADVAAADKTNETPAAGTGETPAASQYYASKSGTAESAAIVTAAAAYLYDKLPDLKADERAARLIENTDADDTFAEKVSGGLVNPNKAGDDKNSAPLADRVIIDGDSADIRGYDFGTKTGTVKINGETVSPSPSYWSSGKITVKAEKFNPGEQNSIEIIRAEDKVSFTRGIMVDGARTSEELPTDGLPNKTDHYVIDGVSVLNNKLYVTGHTVGTEKIQHLYGYDEGTEKWNYEGPADHSETITPNDACSDGEFIYSITDGPTILKTKPGATEEIIYVPGDNAVANTRISYLSGELVVTGNDLDKVILAYCQRSGEEYKMIPFCVIENESVRCIDVVETGGKLLAVCVESLSSEVRGEQLVVYEIKDNPEKPEEKKAEVLFTEKETRSEGTYANAGAVSNGKVISVYRTLEDGVVVSEYTTGGIPIREVTVLKAGVSSVKGEINAEGMLYLAGNKTDADNPPFVVPFETGVEPEPTPTPTPTPTSTPTPTPTVTPTPTATPEPTVTPEPTAAPTPTATPEPTAAPTATPDSKPEPEKTAAPAPAPASTVQTCQDAGFPAGWYWNESKKACVAPAAAPANNGSGQNGGNREGGNYSGNGTNSGTGNGGAYSGTLTPEPTETPEATETPKPTETPEETEKPEETAPPIEIINTKGILWFLGIPVLMILSGLAVFLTKNHGLIPWIIAGDAIGSIALAILDHSVVGWILVVLNLAAVGLLALYRSGKQDEDDDEFEEE